MTAPKIFIALLGAALLTSCSDRNASPNAARPQEETGRTEAIKELLAFFEKRSAKTPSESQQGSIKYYRNGSSLEVVCEARFTQNPEKIPTDEEVRNRAFEFLGTIFTVGEIRRYGSFGIAFTMKAIGPDGVELFKGTVKFAEVLDHFHGHNF